MKLCACIIYYNEAECLPYALKSLKDFPLVICVDGKWKKLYDPHATDDGTSYDGSDKIVRSFKNTMLFKAGNTSEEYMLNMVFHEAAKLGYDAVLMIAADEYLVGDYHEFLKNVEDRIKTNPKEKIHLVKFKIIHITPKSQNYRFVHRVVIDPMFVRLRDIHWQYYYDNRISDVGEPIEGMCIYHDDRPRDKKREAQMKKYQGVNILREAEISAYNTQRKLEGMKFTLTEDDLKRLNISYTIWTNMNDQRIFIVQQLTEQEKDVLKYHFNCEIWKNNKGYNIAFSKLTNDEYTCERILNTQSK